MLKSSAGNDQSVQTTTCAICGRSDVFTIVNSVVRAVVWGDLKSTSKYGSSSVAAGALEAMSHVSSLFVDVGNSKHFLASGYPSRPVPRHRLLLVWAVLAVAALAVHLGGFPLLDPDEGRNAEVGREMALTNDYVMPRLDGLPYLDKPIVYFAAEAAAMEVLGPTETAARLPALLFTFAMAAAAFWFTRRAGVSPAGPDASRVRAEPSLAFIATLASPLTIAFSRTVIFDSALAFFITIALMSFYFAIENGEQRFALLAWVAIGLGVITKGPVAIAIPLLVAIPFAGRKIGRIFPLLGLVLFP